MHDEVRRWVSEHAGHPRRVLELGSRDVNGSVRDLFPDAAYWGVDILFGPGVDEVADAAYWRAAELFDLVLCLETFEHTPMWPLILRTAGRALEPGGRAIFTMATDPRPPHSAIDEERIRPGEFYCNVGAADLVIQLDQVFDSWEIQRSRDPADLRVQAWR